MQKFSINTLLAYFYERPHKIIIVNLISLNNREFLEILFNVCYNNI